MSDQDDSSPSLESLMNLRKMLPGMGAKAVHDAQQMAKAAQQAKTHPTRWCPTCENPHGFGDIKVQDLVTEQCGECSDRLKEGYTQIIETEGQGRRMWMKSKQLGDEGVLRVTTETYNKVLKYTAAQQAQNN